MGSRVTEAQCAEWRRAVEESDPDRAFRVGVWMTSFGFVQVGREAIPALLDERERLRVALRLAVREFDLIIEHQPHPYLVCRSTVDEVRAALGEEDGDG